MLVVDAANVVGANPDGWWKDRPGAAARLVARIRAADLGVVMVVLEGQARRGVVAGTDVVHAPGEGDDAIAALAAPGVIVVTSDRALAGRCTAAGAEVRGARWLLDRLPSVNSP